LGDAKAQLDNTIPQVEDVDSQFYDKFIEYTGPYVPMV
jgi:hypothetical protein